MKLRATCVGLLALVLACGDDGSSPADPGSSTGGPPGTSTLPLPTATETGSVDSSGTTDDPDSGESGPPPDAPPVGPSDCERLEMLVAALPGAPGLADQQALVDDFVRTVSYGDHGFPIAEPDKLAVVHQGEPGQSLSVIGDFNGWSIGEHALLEPVPDLGFYYAIIPVEAPPTGLYKIALDIAMTDFADPLARRFGWDQFGEYSLVDPLPDRGHHERWPGFDEAVGALDPRTVTVYLPAGALGQAGLPVLYMHDGQNLFSPEALFGGWRVSETLEVAIGDGTLPPLVVVGIDNTFARCDEYTPVTDVVGGPCGAGEAGGRADEYADFIVDGIKPFVEARYPVSSDPADVGVMGSSLGGLVSLSIGLWHPDVFGHVGSMSATVPWGTFGLDNPTIVDLYAADPPEGLRIYLDSGGESGTGCPDGDFDNYCGNVELADTLRALGWVDEVDLFYRWQPGAPHNEVAWSDRLLPALVDWFPAAG